MATLTQLENFEAALRAIVPEVVLDTAPSLADSGYIRIQIKAPQEPLALYALRDMLTKLAHAHKLHFDGFDEHGYPCFINEEE